MIQTDAGTAIGVSGEGTTYLRSSRTMAPLYEGLETVGIEARWADGEGIFRFALDVVVTDSSPASVELSCAPQDRVAFQPPQGADRLEPAPPTYISVNLPGIRPDDVVEQMTRTSPSPTGWDGTWQVVRDGSVVASVEYDALTGVACRGSGVGGV